MKSHGLFVPSLLGLLVCAVGARAQGPSALASRTTIKPIPLPGPFSPTTPAQFVIASTGVDDCSNASSVPIAGPGTFLVNTISATDSPQLGLGCTQAHRDVWFEWTAIQTGMVEMTLCGGTATDTVIAVWAGAACPSGTPLACNDDACNVQSRVVFAVTNGSSYLLQIGVYGAGSSPGFSGAFDIVALPPPPSNDECATATVVGGLGAFAFDNTSATTSAQGQFESPCLLYGSTAMERDVWFAWTAPSSGLVTFATCTLTGVDTKIAAYPGAGCPAAGTAIACSDDACASFQSTIEFVVTGGSQYTFEIAVYPGAPGGSGMFSISIPPPPPPPIRADMNIDIGPTGSIPGSTSNTYAAAAGRSGEWNARSALVATSQLDDLAGVPCAVVLTRAVATPQDRTFTNPGPMGDDAALLNDAQDVGGVGGTTTWTFSNLYGGNYAVYSYAWAPDGAAYRSIVSVVGSTDPSQSVGGAWPGAHVLGVTYALHRVDNVPSGGSIAITIATGVGFGTLNGFQLVEQSMPSTPYCFGNGLGAPCPCGNVGAAGNGCPNSVNPSGANLLATGVASVTSDTVRLQGSGMPSSSCLYFQGTTQVAVSFGDGLRCASGVVIRLGTKTNTSGASRYPVAGDLAVSLRGLVPAAGGTRTYQAWYRNAAAFCTASTYNLTNGVAVPWQP